MVELCLFPCKINKFLKLLDHPRSLEWESRTWSQLPSRVAVWILALRWPEVTQSSVILVISLLA